MVNNFPLSPRLAILWKQCYVEEGFSESEIPDPTEKSVICIYPRTYIDRIQKLGFDKTYNFNFRGALYIDEKTEQNRNWIVNFAKQNFTPNSYFQITDRKARCKKFLLFQRHRILGDFDYTFKNIGFVPKETPIDRRDYFDENYFQILSRSEFTLCPAGDAPWSMRFYEAILSKSIPILEKHQHSGRNELEYRIGYKYYLINDENFEYRVDWVEENYRKFIDHQSLITTRRAA